MKKNAKLLKDRVDAIERLRWSFDLTIQSFAEHYGVSPALVRRCLAADQKKVAEMLK
jgi:predicted DNA-binding protein (UPF0251 family)